MLLHESLTYRIIGAAIEVYNTLGSGFLESVYENALAIEFTQRDILFQRQVALVVSYKTLSAGEFRADFVVEDKVIVELKATKQLTEIDEAQLLNYLKATGYRVGLLINFGRGSLQHKRRIL